MLKFFQSLFGSDATTGRYPESLVKAAIERAVDGTDPWIRAVSGYRKKLRPAVVRAIDYVVALVDGMAPAISMDAGSYNIDPRLRTYFISGADMRKTLAVDRNLLDFIREHGANLPRVNALMVMEKQEKLISGAELSGDMVLRDVPQVVVSFESHRLFDPAENIEKTRLQLKHRAFDHLLRLALARIAIVKTERDKLGRYRTLLQSKLNLLQRVGWGFDRTDSGEQLDLADLEALLGRIETQLLELGGDDSMLEVYLDIVIDVLGKPDKNLWSRQETLFIDHMGIKRSEGAAGASQVVLDLACDSEGRSLVVSLVDISGEWVQNGYRA